MKIICLLVAGTLTSCASVNSDWSEQMRRHDLATLNSQNYISNMNTTYVTYKDIKNVVGKIVSFIPQ